jgi:hypothetical protein
MRRIAALAIVGFTLLATEARAQCAKDTDCKGDRICVSGQCQSPNEKSIGAVCGLVGDIPGGISLGLATTEGRQILERIGNAAGLENMPRIVTGPVPNASAAIYGTERLIIYSNSFIESMRAQAGDWAVRFVFAHELGHHVEGHTVSGQGSNHTAEYQADAFATRTMKRMGASRSQTTKAMEAMPAPASGTHPSSDSRLSRIRTVYDQTDVVKATEEPVEPFEEPEPEPLPELPKPTQQLGLPSGTPTIPCGCNGYVALGAARPNPYCQSGVDVAVPCGGWCVGGGQAWAGVCR